MAEELERRGWRLKNLAQMRKAYLEKLKVAGRLRSETIVTFKCIAELFLMGATGYVSNSLKTGKP